MSLPERRVTLKSAAQIERMAVAGALVAEVLDAVGREIRPGVSTLELDALAEERLAELAAERGWDGADIVVSGIPYSLLPRPVTGAILRAAARTLRPGGLFVGYQYSMYLRPYLRSVFGNVGYRLVLLNVPPAFVYTSRRRESAR
jgi:phospholipid N-methyltransferase